MAGDNPFHAGPGERPPALVGREAHLGVIGAALAAARMPDDVPVVYSGRILTGRTTLLDAAAEHTIADGWTTFQLAVHPGDDLGLALARVFEARTGAAMPRPEIRRVLRAIVQLLENEACPGVALFIDDIDLAPIGQAAELVDLLGQAMRNELPVIAAVSCLPNWPDRLHLHLHRAGAANVLPTGLLAPADVRAGVSGPALAAGFRFDEPALDALVRRCRGVPAFMQMLASHASQSAIDGEVSEQTVVAAALDAEHHAVTTFFQPIHDGLSPSQRRFLRALRQAGEGAPFEAVRRHLGEFSRLEGGNSPARMAMDELLQAGVIFTSGGDQLHFSVAAYGPFVDIVG